MKTFYKFLSVLAIPALLILYSNSGGSPGSKTGSVGDNGTTCTQCHSGTSQGQVGWITSNIPAEGYTPGETYAITATGTHDGVSKFGFELTVEDDAGSKLGGLAITDASRTQFTNNNNAVTHTQAGNVPSGNTNTWSMDWTAPEAGLTSDVMFYAAFNAANGNGNTSGDQIYTTSLSVSEYVPAPAVVSVDPDHAEQGWEGMLTIAGDNTTWSSGVFNVRFDSHSDPSQKFLATNIEVKSDTELTCDISIPSDQLIGTYDVYVDAVSLSEGFTVDVTSAIYENRLAGLVNVYPNPSSGYINVNLPEGSDIRVVDMMGHQMLVRNEVKSNERIDVSGLKDGIYFVQIIHEGESATKRFLKN